MSFVSFFLDYKYEAEWAAVLRILLCGFLIFALTFFIRDAWNFSKPNGVFNGNDYLEFCKKFPQLSIFNLFPHSTLTQYIVFIIFYISGFFSVVGLFTQYSLLFFLICTISLQSRLAPIVFTAADSVIRSFLLCLVLTDCGAALSLDVALGINNQKELVDGWAIRLFQIFICILYFGSAIPKLYDRFWLDGNVTRNAALSHMWGKRFLKKWISKNTKCLTIISLVYEYFAPILLMLKETVIPTVIFGIMFHLGITILLRVGCFGPIMCISLLSFLNLDLKKIYVIIENTFLYILK